MGGDKNFPHRINPKIWAKDQPMAQGRHHFDQSLQMPTRLSETEIEHLIEELRLKTKWTGPII